MRIYPARIIDIIIIPWVRFRRQIFSGKVSRIGRENMGKRESARVISQKQHQIVIQICTGVPSTSSSSVYLNSTSSMDSVNTKVIYHDEVSFVHKCTHFHMFYTSIFAQYHSFSISTVLIRSSVPIYLQKGQDPKQVSIASISRNDVRCCR